MSVKFIGKRIYDYNHCRPQFQNSKRSFSEIQFARPLSYKTSLTHEKVRSFYKLSLYMCKFYNCEITGDRLCYCLIVPLHS